MLTTSLRMTQRGLIVAGLAGLSAAPGVACDRPRAVQATYVYVARPALQVEPAPAPAPVLPAAYHMPSNNTSAMPAKATATPDALIRRPAIRPGERVRVPLKFAGAEAGQVSVKFGSLKLNCEILDWTNTHVVFATPIVELEDDVPAQVEVLRANGSAVRDFAITLESSDNNVTVFRDPTDLPARVTSLSTTR